MWTVPGGAQETGGPYMRDPRHPRHFTDDFERQIVDLYNAGKPKREIMGELKSIRLGAAARTVDGVA